MVWMPITPPAKPRSFANGALRWIWLAMVILLAPVARLPGQNFTNLQTVRALPLSAATNHPAFKLRAVVTYSDPAWGVLFVQDGAAAAFVNHDWSLDNRKPDLSPGQLIELEGFLSPGFAQCNLSDQKLLVLGQAPLPVPLDLLSAADLNDGNVGRWVRLSGWAVPQPTVGDRVILGLLLDSGRIVALVVQDLNAGLAQALSGCRLEVTGVLSIKVDGRRQRTADYVLFNNSTNSLRAGKALPLTTAREWSGPIHATAIPEPVRVRGRLNAGPGGKTYLFQNGAPTNFIRLENSPVTEVPLGKDVEAIGFVAKTGGDWVLSNTVCVAIGKSDPAEAPAPANPDAATNTLPTLEQVIQIRNLTSAEAGSNYPVCVTGVLTYFSPQGYKQFLQDETAGIYLKLNLSAEATNLAAGQKVRVTGVTGPGDFAPVIRAHQIQVLAPAEPFPTPIPTSTQLLLTGIEDSQWVSLRGVIRRQGAETNGETALVLSTGDSLFNLSVAQVNGQPLPAELVDSLVEVNGVCRTRFNDRRQLTTVELDIPGWAHVTTLEAAPQDPFALPVRSIGDLFQFPSRGRGLHRTQVQGTVLLRQPDGSFFIQDETGGIRVQQRAEGQNVTNGMPVAVVGFPGFVDGLPVLQESAVRPEAARLRVAPHVLTPDAALNRDWHGTLVELDGIVTSHARRGETPVLRVEFGPQVVEAMLPRAASDFNQEEFVAGSQVRLRGIYVAQLDENREMAAFHLLVPSRDDIVILSKPSWWTSTHTRWTLGALVTGLILTVVWIRVLGHQVKRRTRELQAEMAERQRGEATLRDSEARFATIFHSSPIAISLSEVATGRLLDVNERFLRLFGLTREAVVGKNSSEPALWLHPEARERLLDRLQAGEQGEQLQTKFRWKSGEVGDALVSGSLVQVSNQRYLLCMIADITEHKQLEEQLRQSQKMESIGQLAGGMAHEFNNILAAVLMSLELAETSPAEESRILLQDVKQLCTKAAQLIKQLLAFSRKSVVLLQPLELGAALLRQQPILQVLLGERISLEFCGPFSRQLVQADSVLMEQVLLNLCVNARDAMPKGGKVKVRVEDVEFTTTPRSSRDGSARMGRFLCLSVEDSGSGMDERTLERLFEPFFTTKGIGHGTGLGLATVRGIVEQHHGWVDVESAVNRGSTFRVYLPVRGDARRPDPDASLPPATVHGSGTILLVEDDPAVRILTRKLLVRHGYAVLEAADGDAGLALWQQNKAQIDLLLTDMVMPGTLSGLELAKRVLADQPGLKVLLVSGYNSELSGLQERLHDSIIYLPKPVPPVLLTNLIHDCFLAGQDVAPPPPAPRP